MKKAILATKVGMTQIFNHEDGVLIPVTVLQAGPCVVKGVTQPAIVRPREDGGYEIVSGHRRQKASELAGYADMQIGRAHV